MVSFLVVLFVLSCVAVDWGRVFVQMDVVVAVVDMSISFGVSSFNYCVVDGVLK